jgi:hypothetical protein
MLRFWAVGLLVMTGSFALARPTPHVESVVDDGSFHAIVYCVDRTEDACRARVAAPWWPAGVTSKPKIEKFERGDGQCCYQASWGKRNKVRPLPPEKPCNRPCCGDDCRFKRDR